VEIQMQMAWKVAVLVLAAMFLAGCGGLESSVVGTWKVDVDATKPKIEAMLRKAMGEAPKDLVDKQIKEALDEMGKLTLELKADKTAVMDGKTGSWAIEDGKLAITGPDGKKTVVTVTDNRFELSKPGDPSGLAIVFKKQ
jgi:hypothetical protein